MTQPTTVDDMINCIRNAFAEIKNATLAVRERAHICV